MLLGGEKQSIVKKSAQTLTLDQTYSGLIPQDEVARAEALKAQGKTVAFAGDGINDTPVIALVEVWIWSWRIRLGFTQRPPV